MKKTIKKNFSINECFFNDNLSTNPIYIIIHMHMLYNIWTKI